MNMKLIDPSDPLYFYQTSDEPYDRHHYRVHMKNGNYIDFDDYMNVQNFWFEYSKQFLSHVQILDIQNKKQKKNNRGFK